MKKLINDPRRVVRDMLEGLADFSPHLGLLADENVIVRSDLPPPAARPVAVLSGGGSGHEPAHAGYVGPGLLSAAVAGDVFTSPSADAVLGAIRIAAGPAGAVLIVKNYTGDRLNFGLAAEMARAKGIPTEIVVVADDVALRHSVEPARRRGIAGTVLVHKVAGAAAAAGLTLAEVAQRARAAADELGTMGVALGAATLPGASQPGFVLAEGEIELGLGIHGEPGVERAAMQPADTLVAAIVATIAEDRALAPGERVALLVNGLGATTPLELAIVARAALAALRGRDLMVARAWCGNFLTALDMPGCSLSVMRVDDARLEALDAPAEALAWRPGERPGPARSMIAATTDMAPATSAAIQGTGLPPAWQTALAAVSRALREAEPELAALDGKAGDGDLGASMVRGADAIDALPASAWANPSTLLAALGHALRRAIAGSSGPFYATAVLRGARQLAGIDAPTAAELAQAFDAGVASIAELGGAVVGDRTMLDALRPAADAFGAAAAAGQPLAQAWQQALDAAEAGAAATASMRPRLGRAAYLGERAMGAPDGGAVAVTRWMAALATEAGS
ncbi:dihydroxyacetone kinase family protein [Chelatococcus reniformis]|uniref:Dihydroxyacetone kinase n=1 Tax=Chelatococcus reniformis TaxID=1494448 RepID=A0A916UJJ9_9HYPH|nr:dihydroxyacetone kinase family protein [Chelatococcus reniformis]GGC75321.1 dihydroxyacetone kinase [Chelatococcus reniformis]